MTAMAMAMDRIKIGQDYPTFIIAEAGVNHNGNLDLACQLVDVAVKAKVDAVKFQTFRTADLVIPNGAKINHSIHSNQSQYEMLQQLELTFDSHRHLKHYCQEQNILYLSSPFDEISAGFLSELNMPLFKVPSGEITNLPFIEHMACFGKPMIVSTGMSSLSEIDIAIDAIYKKGNKNIVLLHCVSNYPASPSDCNLHAMHTLRSAFGVPVGYSDHTMGIEISLAAVALGACVIEKHFTLDRHMSGPDHQASLAPKELTDLVSGIRKVEESLGDGRKRPAANEAKTAALGRKSLVTTEDIRAGTKLTADMIAIKRPGTGMHPSMKHYLVGRTTRIDIRVNSILTHDMLV